VQEGATYAVVFSTAQHPIIYSTGYVTLPDLSATVKRVVRVATTNVPLFNVSMAGRTNITMSGGGLETDSFDSSKTNLSNNGRYSSSPGKTTTNGDVAVLYGTLDIGGHTISGDAYLGPTATFSGNGTVTGQTYHDFNSDFPDVVVPNTSGWLNAPLLGYPGIVSIGGIPTTFNYVFTNSGDYIISSMLGTG